MIRRPRRSTRTDTLFPYTTIFRSRSMLVLPSITASGCLQLSQPRPTPCKIKPSFKPFFTPMGKSPSDMRYAKIRLAANEFSLVRSEEHTSELQSLMRISYAVFCLKKQQFPTPQHQMSSQQLL